MNLEDYSRNTRSKIKKRLKNYMLNKFLKNLLSIMLMMYIEKHLVDMKRPLLQKEKNILKMLNKLDENWDFWGVFSRKTINLLGIVKIKL